MSEQSHESKSILDKAKEVAEQALKSSVGLHDNQSGEPQQPKVMGYGWKNEAHTVQVQNWVSQVELFAVLNQLAQVKYNVIASREAGAEVVENMKRGGSNFFGEKTRFPEFNLVNLDSNVLKPLWEKIVQLLNSTDRMESLQRDDPAVSAKKWQASNDQLRAYQTALASLRTKLVTFRSIEDQQFRGVFTRDTFEKHYNLTWT